MKHFFFTLSLSFLLVFNISAQNQQIINEADSLKDVQNFDLALQRYLTIYKTGTSVIMHQNIATCYYNLEMIDSAIIFLQEAITLDANNAESYSLLSEIYSYSNYYSKALVNIRKAIAIEPRTAIYHIKEGSIFLLQEYYEDALNSFQAATMVDQNNADAYYLISYVYYAVNYTDSALKYIDVALNFEQKGDYYKLKAEIFYSQSRFTDAIFEIEKAIDTEGNKPEYAISKAETYSQLEQYRDVIRIISPYLNEYSAEFYHYAVISYFNLDMNDSAFYYIDEGLQKDPINDNLYYLRGYIYFVTADYYNSQINFKAAIELNPENTEYFLMLSNSLILANTDSTILDYNYHFYNFNINNIKKTKKLTKSKKSKYYYSRLLSKFNLNPTTLSIDEYFMLYLGSALQTGFSGYANYNPMVGNAFDSENYEECIRLAQDFLIQHPCSPTTYYFMANSYYMLNDYENTIKYLTIYYGFLNGIMATGDGTTKENAMIIISPADEYAIFELNNLQPAGQELIMDKKKNYDILYYYYNNVKQKMYFSIDLFFGKN